MRSLKTYYMVKQASLISSFLDENRWLRSSVGTVEELSFYHLYINGAIVQRSLCRTVSPATGVRFPVASPRRLDGRRTKTSAHSSGEARARPVLSRVSIQWAVSFVEEQVTGVEMPFFVRVQFASYTNAQASLCQTSWPNPFKDLESSLRLDTTLPVRRQEFRP